MQSERAGHAAKNKFLAVGKRNSAGFSLKKSSALQQTLVNKRRELRWEWQQQSQKKRWPKFSGLPVDISSCDAQSAAYTGGVSPSYYHGANSIWLVRAKEVIENVKKKENLYFYLFNLEENMKEYIFFIHCRKPLIESSQLFFYKKYKKLKKVRTIYKIFFFTSFFFLLYQTDLKRLFFQKVLYKARYQAVTLLQCYCW